MQYRTIVADPPWSYSGASIEDRRFDPTILVPHEPEVLIVLVHRERPFR